jgi:hypothetical protein
MTVLIAIDAPSVWTPDVFPDTAAKDPARMTDRVLRRYDQLERRDPVQLSRFRIRG